MRRVRIRTVEDMMALPEGEWFEVPEGLDLEVSYEGTVRVGKNRLSVEIPKGAAEELRSWTRGPLTARLLNGHLVLERRTRKNGSRKRSRTRS